MIRVFYRFESTVRDLAMLIDRKGDGPLEAGSWAEVYEAGNTLVWRLERVMNRGINPELIPYSRYVMALADGKLNRFSPHAPRIKIHVILKNGVATLMERLDSTLEALPRDYNKRLKTSNAKVSDALACGAIPYLSHMEELPASFELYVENLIDARLGCMDLHEGNIMLRGETLVVTDPVC